MPKKAAPRVATTKPKLQLAKPMAVRSAPPVVYAAAKKKEKKKKSWKDYLTAGVKTALRIAPAVLPLLAQSHAPTAQAISSLGSAAPPGVQSAPYGVPIAMQGSVATETGLRSFRPIMENGRVVGAVYSGVDFLADVAPSATVAEGELLLTLDLNPNSSDWAGTRLQRESSLYSKYSYKSLSLMYQPVCPTTQTGQFILFTSSDAAYSYQATGRTGVQQATGSQGSDMFQVWTMGVSAYIPDPAIPSFYADSDGSDIRFTSPGRAFLVGASAITSPPALGQIYAAWEIELTVPRLSFGPGSGFLGLAGTTTALAAAPLGTAPSRFAESTLAAGYVYDSAGLGWITGLPVGTYDVVAIMINTAAGAAIGAGNNFYWASCNLASLNFSGYDSWSDTTSSIVTNAQTIISTTRMTVTQQASNPLDTSVGAFRMLCSGAVPATVGGELKIYRVDLPVVSNTLQSYEKKMVNLLDRMRALEAVVAHNDVVVVPASSTVTRAARPVGF